MRPASVIPRDELLIRATGFRDLLVGYAFGYLRDWADAEDSVQEALLVVSRRADDYDPARSLFTWVRGILRLRCLERLRARQKETPTEIGELETLVQQHLDEAWNENLKDELGRRIGALRECLTQLPKGGRAMLYDFYVRGLSEKELREQQGPDAPEYATSALRTALYRMRQRLRKCVQERLGASGEIKGREADQWLDPAEDTEPADRDVHTLSAWMRDGADARDAIVAAVLERTALRAAVRQLDGFEAADVILRFPPQASVGSARRRGWKLLAIAAGLALAFSLWRWAASPALPRATQLAGEVSLLRKGAATALTAREERTAAGDVFRTSAGAKVRLRYSSEPTVFELGENGELEFPTQPGRGKLLRLKAGSLHVTVGKQPADVPLRIETPSGRITVVGTRFTVRSASGKTSVDVESGRVRFAALHASTPSGEIELGPGESAEAAADAASPSRHRRGTIARDVWFGLRGEVKVKTLLSSPRFPDRPDQRGELPRLEAPENFGDHFGERIYGCLYPPASGDYTFWIAGDNSCALWLSTDENPANRRLIAGPVEEFTAPREWDRHPNQRSGKVRLEAGRRYFIEVVHLEQTHEDHVSAAWEGPGISRQVIPGRFLSPP